MKLSRLYSNRDDLFPCVDFKNGLNVVLGEIRLPENQERDTHNLGKSTLMQLIDFCLLRRKTSDFFLFKYLDTFKDFVFFLEIQTNPNQYVTIRRAVDPGSTASFMRHESPHEEHADDETELWDQWSVPFDRAKTLLDGYLDLGAVAPWSYRNAIAYSLRTQRDFDEPFKLAKYGGRHSEWKPFLAHILGLDADLVKENYELTEEIKRLKDAESRMSDSLKDLDTLDQLRGLIEIRLDEIQTLREVIEIYNFDIADAEINQELVNDLDRKIAELNEERYYISSNIKRIQGAMQAGVAINIEKIQENFEQARIYFGDQITKDYSALEKFNEQISMERDEYLQEELDENSQRLEEINSKLTFLNKHRSTALESLKDKETFSKYKRLTNVLVDKLTDLKLLKQQEDSVKALRQIQRDIRRLDQEKSEIQDQIAINIDEQESDGVYARIRLLFNDIIYRVIGHRAVLFTGLNSEGNIDFRVQTVDESGKATDASQGYTYGRLLCIAFDMAILVAYADKRYPHFVYHDGALESLDDRKKLKLIEVIREYAGEGIQHIITAIDSELPTLHEGSTFSFTNDEIILRLHDEGPDGRLFRLAPW